VYHSPILRLTAGAINKINDSAIGMAGVPQGPSTQKFAGQLGNGIWLDDANILFDSSMGVVYGGHFRYVRMSPDADVVANDSHALAVGQLVFWDIANSVPNLYQVTTTEAGNLPAGIVLNSGWGAGHYSVIQDVGLCVVHYIGTITGTPAIGRVVKAAMAGVGSDLGYIDQVDTVAVGAVDYAIGRAVDLPVNGQAHRVFLNIPDVR